MSEKKIGRYEIKSELGRGGMATVYLAYDPVLERDVALKLLPNYFAHDPEFSARFEREAKTVAALEHGSIVSMYDYGEDGEWPYFVMRLMKGNSLKDRIADGPMSLEAAAEIVSRVAGALDKAHSKDIVHRDLKPGNIMFDEDGAAYLGDFGIVKLAESSESYTRTGNTLGTPAYMSPEQADGSPDIDGRSDIYSLGIILYEMLAGTAPFTHESMPRLLIMHLTSPIPNVLEARADLPAGIQAVIEKAMAKERDARYATAKEMAEAVWDVVNGTAVATAPEPAPAATRAAPIIELEPEPAAKVESTAQPQTAPSTAAESTAPPPPKSTPPPATKATPTQPTEAKSGRKIPMWVFAVVGVVIVACIGIFALSGGDDPSDDTAAPVVADVRSEEVVADVVPTEPAATAAEPTAEPVVEALPPTEKPEPTDVPITEPTDVPVVEVIEPTDEPIVEDVSQVAQEAEGLQRNYLADPSLWDYSFPEGIELYFENGQAVFSTIPDFQVWVNYLDDFGDGTYEVDITALSAQAGAVGFGMLIMYDEASLSWYEFTLDTNGDAAVFYCEESCDTVDEPFFDGWTFFQPVKTGLDVTNTIRIDANQGQLTFYVNGQEFGTIFDNRRTSGNIGLILYNDSEQELAVVFDNFTYTPAP